MKEVNRQRRIRIIMKPSGNVQPTYGVVLPPSIAQMWNGVYVTVKISGENIILESGTKLGPMTSTQLKQHSKIVRRITI